MRDIVEMNASKNPVIFVGCDKNAYLGEIQNVKHIHYKQFEDSYCKFLRDNFLDLDKGYDKNIFHEIDPDYRCVNNGTYQFLCFLRVYYVKKILDQENLEFVFHIDSDCVMLENTNIIAEEIGYNLAYPIEDIHTNTHLVGSIHNALLNKAFCNAFFDLYVDIFVNKTKLHLLKEKIDEITAGNLQGSICDMNFYYLLWREKILEIIDLTKPLFLYGEFCVFDHSLHSASGLFGPYTYKMTKDSISLIKFLSYDSGKVYQETVHGEKIRLLSIHFNDCAKKRISSFRALLSSQ